MAFIVENEGLIGLFKGIGPQIMKGFLVQGILMMTKERYASVVPCPRLALTTSTGLNCCSYSSSDGLRTFVLKRSRRLPPRLLARQLLAQVYLPPNRIEYINGFFRIIRKAALKFTLYFLLSLGVLCIRHCVFIVVWIRTRGADEEHFVQHATVSA